MGVLYLILNIAAVVLFTTFFISIIKKMGSDKSSIWQLLKSKTLQYIFGISLIIAVPIMLVQYYAEEPILYAPESRIDFGERYDDYLMLSDGYQELILKDTLNIDLHFKRVAALGNYFEHLSEDNRVDLTILKYSPKNEEVLTFYNQLIKHENGEIRDIGNLFLAIHFLNLNEVDKAGKLINAIKNVNLKYAHYAKGRYLRQMREYIYFDNAEQALLKEIDANLYVEGAYRELGFLYYYYSADEKLNELVYHKVSTIFIPSYLRRLVYMKTFNFIKYWQVIFISEWSKVNFLGLMAAFFILLVWVLYIRKIDVYDPEKWGYILATFLLSCCTIFLVYPIQDILSNYFQYYPSIHPMQDFIYDVISIGMVEELVKIIPVFIILWFTKAINEPYDYILYCSISALGFAFIENIGYIQESQLYNINARALMAAVAHMVFSSTIGYGLMLGRYSKRLNGVALFFITFIIASIMHGFYDFWLINDWGSQYEWLTIVFFIVSIHIWFTFKNNALNISNFYHPKKVIGNDHLKLYLLTSLIAILMFSYLVNSFTRGPGFGNDFIVQQSIVYGYFILYLSFGFSRYEIIRGYLAPINIPFNLLVPRPNKTANFSGMPIQITAAKLHRLSKKYEKMASRFPMKGRLEKRVVIDGELNCYLVALDEPIYLDGFVSNKVVIKNRFENKKLNDSGKILIYLFLISDLEVLNKRLLRKSDFTMAGWAISSKRSEKE